MKSGYWLFILTVYLSGSGIAASFAQEIDILHPPLGTEGIYDPENPGIEYLQQPSEALSLLPPSQTGNYVDWVKAMDNSLIKPRSSIYGDQIMRAISMDVIMQQTGSMPYVRFPHYDHSLILSCTNCHTAIFLPKKDANPVNMYTILKGEFCGVCHGKVSFPITDCFRCHSSLRDKRVLDE
jgi:c(7)-type cytochrome triheme protein